MARLTLDEFKHEALSNQEVKEQYYELSPAYEIRKKLIALRLKAGLTQEDIAKKLKTQKSNISRLESVNSKISPKLSTISEYADAIGYKLKIEFEPKKVK
jgi:ribosome-binding protein aMBF1 (putative translation factor)